jgi:hypothetical protein
MTALATGREVNALDSFGIAIPAGKDALAALEEAGADFSLRKEPLDKWSGKPCGKGLFVVVRDSLPTDAVRHKEGVVIGQVGANYRCFPNSEIFVPVVTKLIEETGARIDRFASLDDGRRAFMRLSWDDSQNLRIGGSKVGDIVGRRCIISTAHDGKWAAKLSMMLLRLICSNGMVAPFGTSEMKLTHTIGGVEQLADLSEMAPMIDRYIRQFQRAADMLAETPIKPDDPRCEQIIQRILDPKGSAKDTQKGTANRAKQRISDVMALFDGKQPGADSKAARHTGWGLYSAAVDWLTHGKGTRGENPAEQRFKSLLPGGPAARQILSAWTAVTGDGKKWEGLGIHKQIAAELAKLN